MFRFVLSSLMCCLVLVAARADADRGPSTPEERDRVVRIAAQSDKDPLRLYSEEGRWFSKWLDDVPDIQFGPAAPAEWMEKNVKGDMARIAIFKYAVTAVGYMIEHHVSDPRKSPDQLVAIHTAALEGVVRAYSVIRDLKPENRSAAFDQALEKLNKGEFADFVKSMFEKKK